MPAQGYYGNEQNSVNKFGQADLYTFSDVTSANSTPTADPVRMQAASDYADAQINQFFADGPFNVPLTFTASYGSLVATEWYAVLFGLWLYEARSSLDTGTNGESNPFAGKYDAMRRAVYADMALYKSGAKRLAAQRRWPTPSAPAAAF